MSKAKVTHSGTVIYFDKEGADVEHEGHDFRMRKEVIEGAAGKNYFDVTDHEVMRMIEKDPVLEGPAKRIGDLI